MAPLYPTFRHSTPLYSRLDRTVNAFPIRNKDLAPRLQQRPFIIKMRYLRKCAKVNSQQLLPTNGQHSHERSIARRRPTDERRFPGLEVSFTAKSRRYGNLYAVGMAVRPRLRERQFPLRRGSSALSTTHEAYRSAREFRWHHTAPGTGFGPMRSTLDDSYNISRQRRAGGQPVLAAFPGGS